MRGKPSVFVRAGKLEVALAHRPALRRPRHDFSAFADEELEALAALVERAETADGERAWTEADLVVLHRLEAKLRDATRWS